MTLTAVANQPSILAGPGRIKTYTGTNQAANTEFTETVPAGFTWKLLSVTVSLAQGATQTPQPILVIDDGATVLYQSFGASSAQNASVTTQYTWAPGLTLTAGGAATNCTAPLPANIVLGPGFRISSSTIGKGANTDYGAPAFWVVEIAVR